MTRIVCIGDSHFGPNGRNVDRYLALDQIIQFGLAQPNLGAWLHAGDLNHAKMTIEDRNALAPRLQGMANVAPVYIVLGNHDVDGDVEIFSRLRAKYPIGVISTPAVHHVELATGVVAAIFGVPYVHRGGLVTGGTQHDDLGQAARTLLDPLFVTAGHELQVAQADGELPIFLAHLAIGGAVMSTGQPSVGREIEIDPALLARLGDIPKVLGHIHKHQRIFDAWYLGSNTKNDFGENEDKVFGVLDFASPTSWAINFERLKVPSQYLVEGRLTREGFSLTAAPPCQVCDGFECVTCAERQRFRSDWTGADVRVRYHYKKSETSALDTAHILAEFAGCRSLKLDPIAELEHSVRAPEIAAAVTLDAKVEAYFTRREIPFTPSVAAKLAALQQQPAEQLLAQASRPAETPTPAERAVA